MSARENVGELVSEIAKTRSILRKNRDFYTEFTEKQLPSLGRTTAGAMVLSQIFTDYYTCLETLFLRISQFFENSLRKGEWHKDLLHKMTLDVKDVRAAVLSDETSSDLVELLRFRHFRRYYLDFDYDWDRIDLVEKKYNSADQRLDADLARFEEFLHALGS